MECKKEKNLKNCKCTFECERKGVCCECVSYHRKRKELPGCYFDKETESSGERSIKNWLAHNKP